MRMRNIAFLCQIAIHGVAVYGIIKLLDGGGWICRIAGIIAGAALFVSFWWTLHSMEDEK